MIVNVEVSIPCAAWRDALPAAEAMPQVGEPEAPTGQVTPVVGFGQASEC